MSGIDVDVDTLREVFLDVLRNKGFLFQGTCRDCGKALNVQNPGFKPMGDAPGCLKCLDRDFIYDYFDSLTSHNLQRWAKRVADHVDANHGQALHWLGDRTEGLMFWDDEKEEVVFPYGEIDDQGSVPPRFKVEDGGFDPDEWLEDVDRNSYVVLGDALVREIREKLRRTPGDTVSVTINGKPYTVRVERRYAVGNVASVVSGSEFVVDFIGWVDDDEQFHRDWDDYPEADVGEYVEGEGENNTGNNEENAENEGEPNAEEEEDPEWEENFENEEVAEEVPVVNENALRATLPKRTIPSGTKNEMLADDIEAGNIMTNMMLNATRTESNEGRFYRKSTVDRMGMNPFTKKPIEGRVNYIANLAEKGGRRANRIHKTRKQKKQRKTRRSRKGRSRRA